MEEALLAALLAAPAVAALTRNVSWNERVQAMGWPAVVLTLVTPGRDYHHDGADSLAESRVQIDVWSPDGVQALAIERAITAAIEPQTIIAGWEIGPSFLDAGDSGREDVGGRSIFRRRSDWIVTNRPLA